MREPIVEQARAKRDIAQRRRAEKSAVVRPARKIGAQGTAQAKIEIGRIGIGGNGRVSRQPERDEAIVRELRRRAVIAAGASVTASAIALVRVVEQRQPAGLLFGQRRASGKIGVVFAAVRVKSAPVLLEGFK